MCDKTTRRPHTFHVPVMGTGFTIDTPLKLAKYGISSVISLVDDVLIEQMRKLHSEKAGEPYAEISGKDDDHRARRITEYLNLLGRLVKCQIEALRCSDFDSDSEITRYYELLPDSPLKARYHEMIECENVEEKARIQQELRENVVAGSIDVNIMTKLDRDNYRDGKKLAAEFSDALAALRGHANSILSSSMVFSAGTNPRLYSYIAKFKDFFPDDAGSLKKKIVLKVSDYRSALIQGKFLARKGLWVSEFRVESGVNCGGHAFAGNGQLLGPVLEEFKQKKHELVETLHKMYNKALSALDRFTTDAPREVHITAQGGIGTHEEDELLFKRYGVDSTGWCTPFMLVPEVTSVDEKHLERLIDATEEDVCLSTGSPMGIPFWSLRTSASEEARRRRIEEGKPGSACPKGFLATSKEFGEKPLCTASRAYQRKKLNEIRQNGFTEEQLEAVEEEVLSKACICHDLGGGSTIKNNIDEKATTAVCCGPNIVNFSRRVTLEEMIGHIYGRLSLLTNKERPHMFIREIKLYLEYLRSEIQKHSLELSSQSPKYFSDFVENVSAGFDYYRSLAEEFFGDTRERFLSELNALQLELEWIAQATPSPA
ncbi:hypothetical protein ACFL1X_12600 [Candidatus Hydrogenedentota bacterium]